MFMGSCFVSTDIAFQTTPVKPNNINLVRMEHSVVDKMYITKKVLFNYNWVFPDDWDFDTHLYALFNENAYAGNVNYSKSIVQKVKIKKRLHGEFKWKTIKEIEIHTSEDFNIEMYDYYCPSKTYIEYAYVPVIGGADGDTIATKIYSDFDNYFICERNISYPMLLDASNQIQLNQETAVIKPLGRRYPIVVSNGNSKYYSGTVNATFIEEKNCDFDVSAGWSYRNLIDSFLSNGSPKILKDFEGNVWMVSITDNISRSTNGHYQNVAQTFNWVECGDPYSVGDLYDNNLIDTDIDRE